MRQDNPPRFAILLSSHALPGLADEVPDFSGFWNPGEAAERMPELLSRIAPNTVFVDDVGATELEVGQFGGLDVKPAARQAAAEWDPMMEQTVATVCLPPSIIYSMQGPFPIEIHQGTELLRHQARVLRSRPDRLSRRPRTSGRGLSALQAGPFGRPLGR
jgi:hypothetical protein